jgi:3-methyl-2-oxobutanoate hydroxymethyltransferase
MKKLEIKELIAYKKESKKITCLTSYDFSTAQILDSAGVDIILVGDSLANVFLGLENTFQVGMQEMIYHTQAVSRGCKRALLMTDMPFMSYQVSISEAMTNAGNLIKAGANIVKIEGADKHTLQVIERLTEAGIPVCGHLGYTPQSASLIGHGKVQGKDEISAKKICEQARDLEAAGCSFLVLELMPSELGGKISASLTIPTIGIGAGADCDGQVLVIDDMLGKTDKKLKFVKRYSELASVIKHSVEQYVGDVKNNKFPTSENSFGA